MSFTCRAFDAASGDQIVGPEKVFASADDALAYLRHLRAQYPEPAFRVNVRRSADTDAGEFEQLRDLVIGEGLRLELVDEQAH